MLTGRLCTTVQVNVSIGYVRRCEVVAVMYMLWYYNIKAWYIKVIINEPYYNIIYFNSGPRPVYLCLANIPTAFARRTTNLKRLNRWRL